jgi:hypothetical protein
MRFGKGFNAYFFIKMSNMKKEPFYLILIFLIGCHKTPSVDCSQKTRDLEIGRCLIIGEWDFVKIVRTFDEQKTYFPKDRGLNYKIKFKDNGVAEVFDDNWNLGYKFQDTIRYELGPYSKWSKFPEDSSLNVLYMSRGISEKRPNIYPYFICDDTLHIDNEWFIHSGQYFFARK